MIGLSATKASDVLPSVHTGCRRTAGRPGCTVCRQMMVFLQLIISPPDCLQGEQIMQMRTFQSFPSCLIRSGSARRRSPAAACLCRAPCLTVCLLCTGCLNRVNDANQSHEAACADPQKEFRKCNEREVVSVSPCKHSETQKGISLLCLCSCVCVRMQNNTIPKN